MWNFLFYWKLHGEALICLQKSQIFQNISNFTSFLPENVEEYKETFNNCSDAK